MKRTDSILLLLYASHQRKLITCIKQTVEQLVLLVFNYSLFAIINLNNRIKKKEIKKI